MLNIHIKSALLIVIFMCVLIAGCAPRANLRFTMASQPPDSGTYTLLSMGGLYENDPRRLVILDLEGDGFTFEHSRFERKPQTVTGVSPDRALSIAEEFYSPSCSYSGYSLREISSHDGQKVGYELLPDMQNMLCYWAGFVSVTYLDSGDRKATVIVNVSK